MQIDRRAAMRRWSEIRADRRTEADQQRYPFDSDEEVSLPPPRNARDADTTSAMSTSDISLSSKIFDSSIASLDRLVMMDSSRHILATSTSDETDEEEETSQETLPNDVHMSTTQDIDNSAFNTDQQQLDPDSIRSATSITTISMWLSQELSFGLRSLLPASSSVFESIRSCFSLSSGARTTNTLSSPGAPMQVGEMAYLTPTHCDVLKGRGSRCNEHPGNIAFRNQIKVWNPLYMSLSKAEKTIFTLDKLREFEQMGIRFLEKCHDNEDRWVKMDNNKARKKIGQAFRDCKK